MKWMQRILHAVEGLFPSICFFPPSISPFYMFSPDMNTGVLEYILLYRLQQLTSHLIELKMFVDAVACIFVT